MEKSILDIAKELAGEKKKRDSYGVENENTEILKKILALLESKLK